MYSRGTTPIAPTPKSTLQFSYPYEPLTIVPTIPIILPMCQLASTNKPTYPLFYFGIISSMAVKIAVYSPPTATPVQNLNTTN